MTSSRAILSVGRQRRGIGDVIGVAGERVVAVDRLAVPAARSGRSDREILVVASFAGPCLDILDWIGCALIRRFPGRRVPSRPRHGRDNGSPPIRSSPPCRSTATRRQERRPERRAAEPAQRRQIRHRQHHPCGQPAPERRAVPEQRHAGRHQPGQRHAAASSRSAAAASSAAAHRRCARSSARYRPPTDRAAPTGQVRMAQPDPAALFHRCRQGDIVDQRPPHAFYAADARQGSAPDQDASRPPPRRCAFRLSFTQANG